ncbi:MULTISPECIES: CsbD family protein [Streptomyces]|uniref:CsbD family protein n=1 Tax=Streptomyces TaxID=1883 RepID=UPI002DD8AE7E|nr:MULTISPECIES: CsbD family protein [unclassified Streptomyces]WSD93059.1 CsbD family protein [Streptomyces sp. NBC_01474]
MAGKGGTTKVKGKAKEMTGKVTGNRGKEAEGRAHQAKGEEPLREVHDRARGAAEPPKRRHT